MVSFSSSLSSDWSLAIRPEGGSWHFAPLHETLPASGALALEASLCVSGSKKYTLALAATRPLEDVAYVTACINGEGLANVALSRLPAVQGAPHLYELSYADKGEPPFRLTFGFVTVGMSLRFADESVIELTTMEIPCLCSSMPQRTTVVSMLSELSGSDSQEALTWMLRGEREGVRTSALRESGKAEDRSRSIRAFISLAEHSLATLEKNLSLFRSRPLSRTLPLERKAPAEKVCKVGRAEVEWLTLNPDSLVEVTAGHGVPINGKSYAPTWVRTSLPRRSLDNMENRATLRFAAHVVESLEEASKTLSDELNRMRAVRTTLASFEVADGLLPSLVVADVCLELEEPLVGRILILSKRAKRMLRLYSDALGPLPKGKYKMPRRSKAFQEIPHYAALWISMAEWEAFGEYLLSREALLLGTYKMDRLYEYYALYGLLRWLQEAGFAPDQESDDALESVSYSLVDRYFRNETHVVNRYLLRRGAERLALYYQPIIYGDMRAEGGIDLHRTTAGAWFGSYRQDSYWTPDFLIFVDGGKERRRYVLDAKFRNFKSLDTGYRNGRRDDEGLNEFQKCLAKYRYGILSEDGTQVEGVWLLCGRASQAKAMRAQGSTWLVSSGRQMSDGIAALAPGVNALDELFANLGIARSKSSASQGMRAEATKPFVKNDAKTEEQTIPDEKTAGTSEQDASNAPETSDKPQPKTRTLDTAILEDVLVVWRSLPEQQRKNCAGYSQRELGLGHPFIRTQKPTGRESRYYADDPVDVDGTFCYVFTDWKPMYRAKLAKAAHLVRRRIAKHERI